MRASPLSFLGAVLAAGLVSCGPSQSLPVAAKVNGRDVPMSSVRVALEGSASGERGREASARALERVIDQELLVQAALEARLDHDPQVARALEGARRHVLAQAYVERASSGAGDGGQDEVGDFYRRNPALFSARRIYRFQEVAVEGPTEKLAALKDQLASAKGVDDVAAWLKSRSLSFSIATSTRPAEQVPFNFLSRLSAMQDGEMAVFPTATGASILQLLQSQEAALTEAQAAPQIERFLAGRRRLQGAEETLARLRSKAKIEYLGDFRPVRQEVSVLITQGRN